MPRLLWTKKCCTPVPGISQTKQNPPGALVLYGNSCLF